MYDSPLFCVEYYSGTPFMLSPISTASHDVSYTMPQRYSFLTPGSVMKALSDSHFFTVERRTAVDFSDEPAVSSRRSAAAAVCLLSAAAAVRLTGAYP
jgi:hypothetical protein